MQIKIIASFWRYPDAGAQRENLPEGWTFSAPGTTPAGHPITAEDAAQWIGKGLAEEVADKASDPVGQPALPAPAPIEPEPTH